MLNDVRLNFSNAVLGTVNDFDGQGTGFTSVQTNSNTTAYDLNGIDLRPSSSVLVLDTLFGSNAGTTNTLKNGLQVAIDSESQPFTIKTRIKGPLTDLDTPSQQAGIFLGLNQDNYIKLVFIRNATGYNIQFFEEHRNPDNTVDSSIVGTQSVAADINTLDLSLKANPFTGKVSAAYRIDSGSLKALPEQLNLGQSSPFFAPSARAGLLAFTANNVLEATQDKVTFENFFVQSNPTKFTWSNANAPAPFGRSEGPSAVVDGKLYVFSGFTPSAVANNFVPVNKSSFRYDPNAGTWTQLRDIPVATSHSGTAVDDQNKFIYIAGGVVANTATTADDDVTASRDVYRYNIADNSWSTIKDLPLPRGAGDLSFIVRDNGDKELHYFGGTSTNREISQNEHWSLKLGSTTAEWTSVAPLPEGRERNHLADAVFDGKIYAIGGQTGHNQSLKTLDFVDAYDPETNRWETVTGIPTPVAGITGTPGRSHIAGGTFVMDDRIIVAGGEYKHGAGGSVNLVTAYDPVLKVWTQLTPMIVNRHSGYAGSFEGAFDGSRIFYTSGSDGGLKDDTYVGKPNV